MREGGIVVVDMPKATPLKWYQGDTRDPTGEYIRYFFLINEHGIPTPDWWELAANVEGEFETIPFLWRLDWLESVLLKIEAAGQPVELSLREKNGGFLDYFMPARGEGMSNDNF